MLLLCEGIDTISLLLHLTAGCCYSGGSSWILLQFSSVPYSLFWVKKESWLFENSKHLSLMFEVKICSSLTFLSSILFWKKLPT